MHLWLTWLHCVQTLRPACKRSTTFLWMSVVLAGLSIRKDQLGVTSIVRALGLQPKAYPRLLHFFHTPAVDLEHLAALWFRLVLKCFQPVKVGSRLVLVGDGIKIPKEGRKMPAVKKLHQESQNNSKPAYIFGHSFQALGLLVQSSFINVYCVPLLSRIHEGLVFSNRDRRTLLDKFATLFLEAMEPLSWQTAIVVLDAYYASRKIILPLLAKGHHLVSRLKKNCVAYFPAPEPPFRRPGRPRFYGTKVRLNTLWDPHHDQFISAFSPVYGETQIVLRYFSIDLLWRPIGQLIRFVLVEHPIRGRIILMTTDRTLDPLTIIQLYGYRFKIEVSFKHALHVLGTYAYHFWMKIMQPRPQRSGNQYLHRTSDEYRQQIRRKMHAFHCHVLLGCINQGLLLHLALQFRTSVWQSFRSWMRTMNTQRPPSEAVVKQALSNTFPEFLRGAPETVNLTKFIIEHGDPDRCPGLYLDYP